MIEKMSPKEIDTKSIEKIATTAGLELSEAAKVELTCDLKKMIELFIAMDKIEVCPKKKSDVNTTTYKKLHANSEPSRAVEKTQGPCYKYYKEDSGYFVVPKVLNSET